MNTQTLLNNVATINKDNGIFVNQGPLSDRYGKGVLFIRENVENFGLWWYNSSYMALRAGLNE